MITFLLFCLFGSVALIVGAYCEAPIKNAIDAVKARFIKK